MPINEKTNSLILKGLSVLVTMLLVFTLLPGGIVQPFVAAADSPGTYGVTHNLRTQGNAVVRAGSGDWLITDNGAVNDTSRIRVESGYQGTITLRGVNLQQRGSTIIGYDTSNNHPNLTTKAHWAAMRIFGKYDGDTRSPVTKVELVLDGPNSLATGDGTLQNYAAALQVDQGAQVTIKAIDPSSNTSGKLTARSYATHGQYGSPAAIGAPVTDNYNLGEPGTLSFDLGRIYGGGNLDCTVGLGDVGTQGTISRWYHSTKYPNVGGAINTVKRATAGGNVIVTSGTIDTQGASHGAGIGGGTWGLYLGHILLAGGDITARGGDHSAGIGSGCPHGRGNDGSYSLESSIIALPPSKIIATTTQADCPGLAGANDIMYIGDPGSPLITVRTEDYVKKADIYFDLSDTPLVANLIDDISPGLIEVGKVKFGQTGSDGLFKINADFKDTVTVYTDASSTNMATLGRPYLPVKTKPVAATPVVLPLLRTDLAITDSPSTPLFVGYTADQAKANAQRAKIVYNDAESMSNVKVKMAGDINSLSEFTVPKIYEDEARTVELQNDGTLTLTKGMTIYVDTPLSVGKASNIYNDVLLIEGHLDTTNVDIKYIRRIVKQKVLTDDTNTNNAIKVTAVPNKSNTNNQNLPVKLTSTIDHGASPNIYDPLDVTAKYIITTEKNFASVPATGPGWENLNVGSSNNVPADTTASFSGKGNGTYYIHWEITSGIFYARSKDVADPVGTYGAFGPYFIDTTPLTSGITVGGEGAAKGIKNLTPLPVELNFNKAIVNPLTELLPADFEIIPADHGTITGITNSGDGKKFTATLTPANKLAHGKSFTIKLKAGAASDIATNGNTVSNTVTVTLTSDAGVGVPTAAFVHDPVYASLKPSFGLTFTPGDTSFNQNLDTYLTAGGASLSNGVVNSGLITVTKNGGGVVPPANYTITYSKTATAANPQNNFTITFNTNLDNDGEYTVALGADKLFNLLQKSSPAISGKFKVAVPDYSTTGHGLSVNPTILTDGNSANDTVTLTIKGKGLKIASDAGLLKVRVAGSNGYDSGNLATGFTTAGGVDTLTIPGVPIAANTGSDTVTHTFTLFQTFGAAGTEANTGKTATVKVEPANSKIITLTNNSSAVTDLTYGYTLANTQGSKQVITIKNNGAVNVTGLDLSFTGGQSGDFTNDALSKTILTPGESITVNVYLNTGKNAGDYISTVKVTGSPQGDPKVLSSTVPLVTQKVGKKAGTTANGLIVGTPAPSGTLRNLASVVLSTSSIDPVDSVEEWAYNVTTSTTTPAAGWTKVTGGATSGTYNFPIAEDTYYIHWTLTTNNYSGMSGVVDAAGVKTYVNDTVKPTVALTTTATAAGSGTLDVLATFSENVTTLASGGVTVQNGAVVSVTPVSGSSDKFTITIQPNGNLTGTDNVVVSINAGAVKDPAGNDNLPSGAGGGLVIPVSNDRPQVVAYGFTPNQKFVVAPNDFVFEVKSNGNNGNPNLYRADETTRLTSGCLALITTLTREGTLGSIAVTGVISSTATGVKYNVTHPSGAFPDGKYTVEVLAGEIKNQEGNPIVNSTSKFEIWNVEPVIPPGGTNAITVTPATMPYSGGEATIVLHGKNLNHATPGSISLKMTAPTPQTFTNYAVSGDGATATFKVAIPPNTTMSTIDYVFEGYLNTAPAFGSGKTTIDAAIPTIDPAGTGFKVVPPTHDYMGGSGVVTVKGENFHNFNNLKVVRHLNGTLDKTYTFTSTPGVNVITINVDHPQNTNIAAQNYIYYLVDDNNPTTAALASGTVDVDPATGVIAANALTVSPLVIDSVGGKTTVQVTGVNMHNIDGLRVKRTQLFGAGTVVEGVVQTAAQPGGPHTITLTGANFNDIDEVAQNFTEHDQQYKYELLSDAAPYGQEFTLTVEAARPSVEKIEAAVKSGTVVSDTPSILIFDNDGGSADLTVVGKNLQAYSKLELLEGTKVYDLTVASPTSIINSITEPNLVFAPNPTRDDVHYVYTVEESGNNTGVSFTVIVEGSYPKADSLTAIPEKHTAAGGVSALVIKGRYLENFTKLEILDDDNNVYPVAAPIDNGKTAISTFKFPQWHGTASGGLRNDEYVLWVYTDGNKAEATATVVVGDSVPNIQSAEADPNYYATPEATYGEKGLARITVHGNYLYNYDSITVHETLQDDWYTINAVDDVDDRTASGLVRVPSAIGVYKFDIYTNDEFTGITVEIRVGVGLGDSGIKTPEEIEKEYPGQELEKGDKYWKGFGGGSKGRGFTGRLFVGYDLLEHQAREAARANPKAPLVIIPDVFYITRSQLDRAAVAANEGARESSKAGREPLMVVFDTTMEENAAILEGRIFVDLGVPVPDLYPGVFVVKEETQVTKQLFKDRFGNEHIAVVSLGMNGSYGVDEVEIAANLDLDAFNLPTSQEGITDTSGLYFYILDRKTGEFKLMDKPQAVIDDIGFIHFMTKDGGDIIVTDKAFSENSGTFRTEESDQ